MRCWLVWTTLGEAAGFAVAAATGALVTTGDLAPGPALIVLVGAGAVEGVLLGTGQVLALRTLGLPRPLLRAWPAVTCAAAVVAWSIGLLPSSLPGLDWSSPAVWAAAGLLGLILLATIPTAQILLLRWVVRRPWRWLPANAVGWLLGIGWTVAVSPLVDERTPFAPLVATYVVAGALMALTVAVATGLCWVGWLARGDLLPARSSEPPPPGHVSRPAGSAR